MGCSSIIFDGWAVSLEKFTEMEILPNMASFKIFTDSCSDLPQAIADRYDIGVAPLTVDLEGDVYDDRTRPAADLYAAQRAGKTSKSAAVNPDRWVSYMEPVLKEGRDILVLDFAAVMSATYQSAVIAADELREHYPDRKSYVLDTLSATAGQCVLIQLAAEKRDAGEDIDAVYNWIMDNRTHVCHWVTVNDLMLLKRGGRLSASSAVMGTMLQVKPLLVLDETGALQTFSKVRARKTALNTMADKVTKTAMPEVCDTAYVFHADCLEDAEYLAEKIKADSGIKNVVIDYVGSVIGTHLGCGGLVVGFFGTERK